MTEESDIHLEVIEEERKLEGTIDRDGDENLLGRVFYVWRKNPS